MKKVIIWGAVVVGILLSGTFIDVAQSGDYWAKPYAWCGWFMRTRHGGDPRYNLAANWAHRGQPSGPKVGAIVVWPHHVGEIVGRDKSGQWVVLSGNDGHRVRERPRSLGGVIAIRTDVDIGHEVKHTVEKLVKETKTSVDRAIKELKPEHHAWNGLSAQEERYYANR